MKTFHWRHYNAYKQVGKRADAATALRMFLNVRRGMAPKPSAPFDVHAALEEWFAKAKASSA